MPNTNLNAALPLLQNYPVQHTISIQQAAEFWRHLIYLVKRRENAWQTFLKLPENRSRSVAEVERLFDAEHPEILASLARLWDRILAPAGLEFDYAGASLPVQLTDNLQAHIRLKGSGQQLAYNQLSSGIQTFLFRLGHLHALFFGQHITRGFVLLDEPENSLHPDFLYDIIDVYRSAAPGAQLFVATHNPIVAAQFPPVARILLDFEAPGVVRATRGVTPEGDDPNDLLVKDFRVHSLYGKRGLEKWERYLELRRLMEACEEPAQKRALAEEYLAIGLEYGFGEGEE